MPADRSDVRLDEIAAGMRRTLIGLRGAGAEPEVEGHSKAFSDKRFKRAVEQVESALAALRELEATPGGDADVEGHMRYSDQRLKQAVEQVESALAALRELAATPAEGDDVEGHYRYSDQRLKQAVEELESALDALRRLPTR